MTISGGTFNMGTTAEKWLKIAAYDTGSGQIDINSGTLNLNFNSDIRFNPNSGTGTSVINQNGGSVVSYSNDGSTGSGTLGGNTVLDMEYAGTGGNNTYNLNGGTLAISQVMSTVNAGTRIFNFNGGTLKVASSANAASFFNLGTAGTTRANVRNGGAIIDDNGIAVTIAQALVHSDVSGDNATDGGLTKSGSGTLALTGANTYTGATTVSAGTLEFGKQVALCNNQTGSWTDANLVVNSGARAAFSVGGTGEFTSSDIDALKALGTASGGFKSGSFLGLDTANASGGIFSYGSAIANPNSGANTLGLVKMGAGTLALSGANTYTGSTTIGAGTLLVTGALGSSANYAGTIANSGLLYISNSANQTLSGASPSLGSVFKQGEGTLTFSANNTFSGSGANGIAATFQGGSTRITAGTQTVTGELAVGGTIAAGGAGVNSALTIAGNSAVNISSWLSVGRGNGTGGVSSDLVLSNNAAVTAANFSGGWNANSASNTPRGSVTLNDNSSLAITGNGLVYLGESAGSQLSMTLNGASTLTAAGSGSKYIGTAGAGTLTINGTSSVNLGTGTTYVGSAAAGSVALNGGSLTGVNFSMGNANTAAAVGSITVSGGTLRARDWLVLGFNGAGTTNQVTISGGAVNVGSGAGNGILFHQQNTASGVLNISSGSLNVWSNGWITAHPSWASGTGTAVINQTGGSVTFYSDAGSTVGGAGYLDLQAQTATGAATNSTTYNLDGGTLTVPKVISSQATGTRVFNFNGGTLAATTSTNAFFNLGAGAVANVRNGGAIIDDGGNVVTIAQALAHSAVGGDNATDGGLTKSGNGTLTLSGNNTYNGGTTLSAGALRLNGTTAAGTGTITQSAGDGTSWLQINTTGTVANAMNIYRIATLQSVTLSGNKTLNNATYDVASGTTTIDSGNLTGTGGVTKTGAGSLTLTGSNTHTGAVDVQAGVLELASTSGQSAGTTSSVSVSSGATLLISQSNQVNDSAPVTLSGGAILFGSGVSETFGALTLTAASTLDFGTGTSGTMWFGGSYTGNSYKLTLSNLSPGETWMIQQNLSSSIPIGTYASGTQDFGAVFSISSSSGFTSAWDSGTSTFSITAIPEPSTYVAAVGLIALFAWPLRRKFLGPRR